MGPLIDLPRMADFAQFAEAVCQGMGYAPGASLAAYDRNRKAAHESALEDSPVARTIKAFLGDAASWAGTASELLDELNAIASEPALASKAWPRNPKSLSSALAALLRISARPVFPLRSIVTKVEERSALLGSSFPGNNASFAL